MIKLQFYLLVIIAICAGVLVTSFFIEKYEASKANRVTVGQVWRFTYKGDDPFVEQRVVDREVVDVKAGYVKYKLHNAHVAEGNVTVSLPIISFLENSELQSDK